MTLRWRPARIALGVVLTASAFTVVPLASSAVSASQLALAHFRGPSGIATCGSHVWVTNAAGDSVTELASDGRYLRTVADVSTMRTEPMGVAANATDLWVTNLSSDTVVEIDCNTGQLIRTITAGDLNNPVAVAVGAGKVWVASQAHRDDVLTNVIPNSSSVASFSTANGALAQSVEGSGANGLNGSSGIAVGAGKVWVANANGDSVTELDATNGHVVRVIEAGPCGFDWPMGLASSGGDLWVANLYGNSLTEIDESTGSVMRVVSGDGLNGPSALCVLGTRLWVTNLFGNSVTELNARDGSLVRIIAARSDGLRAPMAITGAGSSIWVANQWGDTVTQLRASSGARVRVIG